MEFLTSSGAGHEQARGAQPEEEGGAERGGAAEDFEGGAGGGSADAETAEGDQGEVESRSYGGEISIGFHAYFLKSGKAPAGDLPP